MTDNIDLIGQAATGSKVAQLGLVHLAMTAGESGAVRHIEALIGAETWARLAAAGGGIDEHWALVRVLLARTEFEISRCVLANAEWYEGEARRVLKLLVALDDEDALQALLELEEGDYPPHHAPDPRVHLNMQLASGGDLSALASLCDEALTLVSSGQSDPFEGLTAAELYARLGSASGDMGHLRRLAGILLERAKHEYHDGSTDLADSVTTEATVLLSILVDTGDHSMATWLTMLVNDSVRPAIAKAIQHRPTILKFIEPEGIC